MMKLRNRSRHRRGRAHALLSRGIYGCGFVVVGLASHDATIGVSSVRIRGGIDPGIRAGRACAAVNVVACNDALIIQRALDESRIRVIAVKDRKLVTKLQRDFGLGRGEAEAIVLALADKARILGIDDKNGINACKLLGVVFTTAIGLLVRMREKRLLTTNESLVDKLPTYPFNAVLTGPSFPYRPLVIGNTSLFKTLNCFRFAYRVEEKKSVRYSDLPASESCFPVSGDRPFGLSFLEELMLLNLKSLTGSGQA